MASCYNDNCDQQLVMNIESSASDDYGLLLLISTSTSLDVIGSFLTLFQLQPEEKANIKRTAA